MAARATINGPCLLGPIPELDRLKCEIAQHLATIDELRERLEAKPVESWWVRTFGASRRELELETQVQVLSNKLLVALEHNLALAELVTMLRQWTAASTLTAKQVCDMLGGAALPGAEKEVEVERSRTD